MGPADLGRITQARRRLGPEPLRNCSMTGVAEPAPGLPTRGAFLAGVAADGHRRFRAGASDSPANAAVFGYASGESRSAFPKVRVVTIGECGSHAKIAAQIGPVGGKGTCEQALARRLFPRLEQDWLLIADRGSITGRTGTPRPPPAPRCCGG